MSVYFTSDLHFGSRAMINKCNRPQKTVGEMNKLLIDNWNSTVSKFDIVYILGDFSDLNLQLTLMYLDKLNGSKHLIVGNHDERLINSNEFRSRFVSCDFYKNIAVDNHRLILSHYPIYKWNGSGKGYIHLHGHIHKKQLTDKLGFCYNVGVDANDYRPIELNRILKCINYPDDILPMLRLLERDNYDEIVINDICITNNSTLYKALELCDTNDDAVNLLNEYSKCFTIKDHACRNIMKLIEAKDNTRLRELFRKLCLN